MAPALSGTRIAILGGDARSFFYIPALQAAGATVKAVGFDQAIATIECELVSLSEALMWANVLILPMSGIANDGRFVANYTRSSLYLTAENCSLSQSGILVLTGVASAYLKELAAAHGWQLVEIAEIDDLAIFNSVPSAEGAIQMAMEASDITIHGNVSLVLGFGRCGTTLAWDLMGLGAQVIIAARKSHDRARAKICGCQAVDFLDIPKVIGQADFIYNTAPALVLPQALLALTKPEVVIIDIASGKGGVDYAAARRLGRKALLAPSLPGKVAPRSAGMILGELLPWIIMEHMLRRD